MKKQKNPVKEWLINLKNTKKSLKKVKSSPYASLVLRQKISKMIILPLILFIIWKGYDTISNYHANGFMNTIGKLIMFFVFAFLVYRIYSIIPAAKKQIELYKKYPHMINYCPTDVKEDIDDIINKIKENKVAKEEEKNVQKNKRTKTTTSPREDSTTGN